MQRLLAKKKPGVWFKKIKTFKFSIFHLYLQIKTTKNVFCAYFCRHQSTEKEGTKYQRKINPVRVARRS